MTQEQYLLSHDTLILHDPELELSVQESCILPRLGPGNLLTKEEHSAQGDRQARYCHQEGIRHGECHLFHDNGALRSSVFYKQGRLHGPSSVYAPCGTLLAKSWYYEGRKEGKAHFYALSQALVSRQRFRKGQWHGMQEYFYETGALKSQIPFHEGKYEGTVQLFWERGQPKREVKYTQGLRHGTDKLWTSDGILLDEGAYEHGAAVGRHTHYFPNGKKRHERLYHTPLRFDRKEWDESGHLLVEGSFGKDLSYTETRYGQERHTRKGVWDGDRIRWQ